MPIHLQRSCAFETGCHKGHVPKVISGLPDEDGVIPLAAMTSGRSALNLRLYKTS